MIKEFSRKNIEEEWNDLVNDFPEIFLNPSPQVLEWYEECVTKGWSKMVPEREDLCNLRYGFECEIGWKQIIREFCEDIQKLVQKAESNGHDVHYSTFILKEKFGECCDQGDFYGNEAYLYYDEYRQISINLRAKSSKTCEISGEEGKLRSRTFWVRTLSDKEAEKHNYEKI